MGKFRFASKRASEWTAQREQRRLFRSLERVSDVGTIDYRTIRRDKCVTPIPRGVPVSSSWPVIRARMHVSNEAFGTATQFLKPFNPFLLDRRQRQQYWRARGSIIFIAFMYNTCIGATNISASFDTSRDHLKSNNSREEAFAKTFYVCHTLPLFCLIHFLYKKELWNVFI